MADKEKDTKSSKDSIVFNFGDAVQYQAHYSNFPFSQYPQLAFVTGVTDADPNDPNSVARYNITVIPRGADYVVTRDNVTEGGGEGQIQTLGSMSDYQKEQQALKDAAAPPAAKTDKPQTVAQAHPVHSGR